MSLRCCFLSIARQQHDNGTRSETERERREENDDH